MTDGSDAMRILLDGRKAPVTIHLATLSSKRSSLKLETGEAVGLLSTNLPSPLQVVGKSRGREWLGEIRETPRFVCGLTHDLRIVSRHVDNRHGNIRCLETVPQLNA